MNRLLSIGCSGLLGLGLAACAVTPLAPLPATNPASPSAREAAVPTHHNSLAPDEATKKSQSLLETAGQGTNSSSNPMPNMNMGGMHDGH